MVLHRLALRACGALIAANAQAAVPVPRRRRFQPRNQSSAHAFDGHVEGRDEVSPQNRTHMAQPSVAAERCGGRFAASQAFGGPPHQPRSNAMNQIIYIIGLIVVVMAVLAFLGLR